MPATQFIGLTMFSMGLSLLVASIELHDATVQIQFAVLAILCIIGFLATYRLIPAVAELCLKENMFGYDINKDFKDGPKMYVF